MTYLRKGKKLRGAVIRQLRQRIANDELVEVDMGDNSVIFINPELLESRAPRSRARVKILSPFDNSVIQRQRVRDLFDFDYQIECYVPQRKRQFGYFCLPILYRDRLVGRVDCKAHRACGILEIKSLSLEENLDDDFIPALNHALREFAGFNGCRDIEGRPEMHSIINKAG